MTVYLKRSEMRRLVLDDTEVGELEADAPEGYIWEASDSHSLLEEYFRVRAWRKEARTRILSDMALGLRKCDMPECDVCERYEGPAH